jgi:CheY-like chemotaxis protein
LELIFRQPSDLPSTLIGDALRLGQVLTNLGNNAVKFTTDGEIVVEIQQQERTEGRVVLRFGVRDTGLGMTSEQKEKLFQPFTQGEASTARRFGGTGLGLAISQHLVKRMGGKIEIWSEPGVGSEFSFSLTFGIAEGGTHAGVALEGLDARILVVDDNATTRKTLMEMARGLGLKAASAKDAIEALRAIRFADAGAAPLDLVLLDWEIAGVEGSEAARMLMTAELRSPPAIVIMTSTTSEEVKEEVEGADLPACQIVAKPVTPLALHRASSLALGRVPAHTQESERVLQVAETWARLKGIRILLVEDNEINQEIALTLLQEAGASVLIAENGEQALEKLTRQDFDVVLMDCQMPIMDGFEATRLIRTEPKWAELPILAMTANAMAGDREKAIQAGMNDHIAKPIDVSLMFETIENWVRHFPQVGRIEEDRSGPGDTPR